MQHFNENKFMRKSSIEKGTLPWIIFRIRIFLNYLSQKFEKLKITIQKSDNSTTLTRKVSQVSLTDFNDSLICCRASKNKTRVIFFIGGKTDLGSEIDP